MTWTVKSEGLEEYKTIPIDIKVYVLIATL